MACVEDAINTYFKRSENDTNSRIVRMISPTGKSVDHWYYKSDEVIFTSGLYVGDFWLDDFEGPIENLPNEAKPWFLEGLCKIAPDEMFIIANMKKREVKNYKEYMRRVFSDALRM